MVDSRRGSAFLNVMATISVLLAGLVTWRLFFPPDSPPPEPQTPTVVAEWKQLDTGRHSFGPADAPVTIIEFADFECPACRAFNLDVLAPLRAEHPGKVRWVFRHWPLSYHRFAAPAARAAECAADQGRFEAFHDAVYLGQDSLGLKAWGSFASAAGVPDTVAFNKCNSLPNTSAVAEADSRVALDLKGRGTPLLIVNGLQFPGVPSKAELDRVVDSILAAGK